ncbi:MAG: D-glycero-beta-D-manno-heptose 1,7-bisphosphate 7-phosphatase [Methylovulum sp.]|nr:MAG: D-glycero-beta-D-manno-heptose 1,7-bisphosphate 7-phosphatase [Methylovulum sp.]
MTENRYVLLDRDGVINHDSDDFIKSPEEWQPIDGSLEAIALLNAHGYRIAVITNQSGLARGLFDDSVLEKIHQKMHRLTNDKDGNIDAIYFCPHGADSACNCRKPKPGLLELFAAEKHADLAHTYFIGDSWRDIQAALAAGALPMLVKTGKGQKTLTEHPNLNIPVFDTLYDAAKHIVSGQ